MGLLSSIFEKLGIGKKKEEPVKPTGPTSPKDQPHLYTPPTKPATPSNVSSPTVAPGAPAVIPAGKPAPMEMVDVVSKLDKMAVGKNLNWKVSIVDLLKVLGIDSSLEARKELATELGCPKELMGDSAKMNTWLHKEVLKKISENGGNIPKELLD
jgi:hypothetical protein